MTRYIVTALVVAACGDNLSPPGPGDVGPPIQCAVQTADVEIATSSNVCPAGSACLTGENPPSCSCDFSGNNYSSGVPAGVYPEVDSGPDGCRAGDLKFAMPTCAYTAEASGIAGNDTGVGRFPGGDGDDGVSICPMGPWAMRPFPFNANQELRDPGSFEADQTLSPRSIGAIGGIHAEVQDCRYYRQEYFTGGPAAFDASSTICQGDLVATAGDWIVDRGHTFKLNHAEIHEARIIAKTVPSQDAKTFYALTNAFFTRGTQQESMVHLDIPIPVPSTNGLPAAAPLCTFTDNGGRGGSPVTRPDPGLTGCAMREDVKSMRLVGVYDGVSNVGYCQLELTTDHTSLTGAEIPANFLDCTNQLICDPAFYDLSTGQPTTGGCCGYSGGALFNRSSSLAEDIRCGPIAYAGTIQATWDAPGDLYQCECDCDDPAKAGATISATIQGCAPAQTTDGQAVCDSVCGGIVCSAASPACDINSCRAKSSSPPPTLVATSICDADHQPFVRVGPDGDYRVDVDPARSSVVFKIGDITTSSIPINGTLHVNLSSGTPRVIEFSDIILRPRDFDVQGQSIRSAIITTIERLHGQMVDSTTFEIPPGIGVFGVRARLNGDAAGVQVVNPDAITGTIDFSVSPPAFSLDVVADDVQQGVSRSMRAHIEGIVDNLPPTADASRTPKRVECTGPGLTSITLDGTASSDADQYDFITHYQWFEQALGISNQAVAHVSLPLGVPTGFTLHVYDDELGSSMQSTTVTVVDTTPPILTVSPTAECVWPPDHKMQCYQLGTDIRVTATDTCDPNPTIKVASVVSSQPDDGTADGHTTGDATWTDTQFCVRRERAATAGPRKYTVTIQASDSSGNTTSKTVTVTVPSNQATGCK